jgi:sugar phosphate isomerase/epimerase
MEPSRRQFIKSGAALTLGLTMNANLSSLADQRSGKIPIGFQLYTARGEFSRNVPDTLKQIAGLGYKAVEFWGYAGTPTVYQKYSAQELRKLLDDNGLKCCGIHMELKAIAMENLTRTIENNQILGNQFLNVAAAESKMSTEKGIKELAATLNDVSAKCAAHRMAVGYHAHPFDFARIGDKYAWELLFDQTHPEVNMQMDVGNCLTGNGDPIAMLKKFPGRTLTIHIKEHGEKTFDSDYYREVFQLCETTAGTQWYIVEMGGPEGNGFDVPRAALEKLHKLGK